MKQRYSPNGARCSTCKRPAARLVRLGDNCNYNVKAGSQKPCPGIIVLPRKVTSEERTRNFLRNGVNFRIVAHWHWLDAKKHPDMKYHYIHVYRGSSRLPFRWWRWVEYPDGAVRFLSGTASGKVSA